ncbi:MAG: hypothetical protein O7D91_07615 [Planctomycetota bacterium]|nr:hypothetical protein [Planctomycetota bacterium]
MKRRTVSKILVLAIILPIAVRAWQRIGEVVSAGHAGSSVETLDTRDSARSESTDQ